MRLARKQDRLVDLGLLVILVCTLPLAAIVVLHLAGYPVPRWLVGAVLSLCLVCLIVALVIGRSKRRS